MDIILSFGNFVHCGSSRHVMILKIARSVLLEFYYKRVSVIVMLDSGLLIASLSEKFVVHQFCSTLGLAKQMKVAAKA